MAVFRAIRARGGAALDALSWAIEGLYQIWFAAREQHEATARQRAAS